MALPKCECGKPIILCDRLNCSQSTFIQNTPMTPNDKLPEEYNPIGCEHKHANGFTAWQMQSDSSGSGPDFDEHVTICVCTLCGDINIAGRKWDSKSQQTNRFNETFHICAPRAIDAIIKQANFFNEEAKWGRLDDTLATVLQEFVSKHESGLLPDRFVYEKAIKILKDGTIENNAG